MTFCNHEFTELQLPAAVAAKVSILNAHRDNVQNARRPGGGTETRVVLRERARSGWAESAPARGDGALEGVERSYFSPPPCAAVRRASSKERRMSIAIVDSGFASLVFSSCSIARRSVSDSSGKLTEVSAVELLPFAD